MAVIIEWANGTKSKTVPNMSAAKTFITSIEERPIEIYNRETGEFTKIEDSMKRKIKDIDAFKKAVIQAAILKAKGASPKAIAMTLEEDHGCTPAMARAAVSKIADSKIKIKDSEVFLRVPNKREEDITQEEANKLAKIWAFDNDKRLVSAKVGSSWTVPGVYVQYKDSKRTIPMYKVTISNKDGKTIKSKVLDSAKKTLAIKKRVLDSKHGLKIKVTKIKDATVRISWISKNKNREHFDFSNPQEAKIFLKKLQDKHESVDALMKANIKITKIKDGCHKTHDADIRQLTRKDFIAKYNAGVFKGKLKPEDMQRGKWTGTYKSGESVTVEFKDNKKHKIAED